MNNVPGNNPFANICNFDFLSKQSIHSIHSTHLNESNQPQSSSRDIKCSDNKIVAKHISSGAHGTVYSCGDEHVYKKLDDAEYGRVRANLGIIIPLLEKKNLLQHTCFNKLGLGQIFDDTNHTYKMNLCTPINTNNLDSLNKIVDLIAKFSNAGFVHGDIKFDNIMLLGDEYVLTDLDDMSFIQIEKGVITCSNTNEPMFTPMYVHPVYLKYRSLLQTQLSYETNNKTLLEETVQTHLLYETNNETLLEETVNEGLFLFNVQSSQVFKRLITNVYPKPPLIINNIDDLHKYLVYSDLYSLYMNLAVVYTLPPNIITFSPMELKLSDIHFNQKRGGGNAYKRKNKSPKAIRMRGTPIRKIKISGKSYNVYKINKRCMIIYKNKFMYEADAKRVLKF